MKKKAVRVILGTVAALVLVVFILSGFMAWKVWRISKPMTTVGRMRNLMSVLIAEQPTPLNKQTVIQALKKYGRDECYIDGWEHPFLIEPVRSEAGEVIYRVTSLGSDGRRGSCCRGFVDSYAEDAVLERDVWLQQWSFGHSPVATKRGGE